MKKYLLLLLPLLSGCFEDQPEIPIYWSKQEINIPQDTVICRTEEESFSHYLITYTVPNDSVQWYLIGSTGYEYFGTGQQIEIPVSYPGNQIMYRVYSNGTYYHGDIFIFACTAHIYIPVAFTPNSDGINDEWSPLYTASPGSYSVHWEIRTPDGIKVFESDDLYGSAWDGTYNGHGMPVGYYLYYIELTIEGEDLVEYTGWLELFG